MASTPASEQPARASKAKKSGKGRPTPTRKQARAEALARARASAGLDTKTAKRIAREKRQAAAKEARDGLKAGIEEYLPARDKGPLKRFLRNYVDARLTFLEMILPILILLMILMSFGNERLNMIANQLWTLSMMLMIVEGIYLVIRARRLVKQEFPGAPLKGVNSYTLLRAIQMRFMRLPKTQVGIGGRPIHRGSKPQ